MDRLVLLSDQLSTWSANGRYSVVDVAQASPPSCCGKCRLWRRSCVLAHRALQALRQTRLQVCRRPRSWSQVLTCP